MGYYDRLAAMDAQFLYWDTEETPMNMGNICIFEGAPLFDEDGNFRLEDVRRLIDSQLHQVPRYRKKIMTVPGNMVHPVMVDDPDFNIANHVKLMSLPKPGNEEQLKDAFARVHEGTLDRSKPLWEIWFVEGLEGDRVGMIQKIHHAPFDGQSTVDILERILDPTPEHKPVTPPPWNPAPPPSALTLVLDSYRELGNRTWEMMVSGPYAPFRDPPWKAPVRMVEYAQVGATMLKLLNFRSVPKSTLNQPLGRSRRFDWVSTTLADVKKIRALAPGATLNDVMLACIAGGLRDLLSVRGDSVVKSKLRVFVPVSMRADSERDVEGGNRISGFVAPLPVDDPDALSRLRSIESKTRVLKGSSQPAGIHMISQLLEFLFPPLHATAAPTVIANKLWQNLTVTNVVGPRVKMYLLGAEMLELKPMVPIGCQLSLNVAVESYAGNLSIGLSADGRLLPDLDIVKAGTKKALEELLSLTRGNKDKTATSKKRKKSDA